MHFISEHDIDAGVTERAFTLGETSGLLWAPSIATPTTPVPLVLLGQPGGIGMRRMYSRLAARAHSCAAHGFAAASIELPGAGERPPLHGAAQARTDLLRALAAGQRPDDDVIDRLILPLVEAAVPEWQTALDALLDLPEIGERVGYSGGVLAIGVRLAAIEPRIVAAGLFAGSYVPRSIMTEARQVTIPVHMLLQWDDEGNDRQAALDLFDALASPEKTLLANLGGHTGVPPSAGEAAVSFFTRYLGRVGD